MTIELIMGVIFGLIGIIQAAFWLWVKTSIASLEALRVDLMNFQLMVANEYVKQSDLDKHMDRIDKSLDDIKSMIEKLTLR